MMMSDKNDRDTYQKKLRILKAEKQFKYLGS